ncbi:Putative Branched-chain amino acid ABC transporter (Permease protein); livH-like protein (plasmid) [Neorhizobium galegae bv. officinalis bv. officinalis str. HAMBI 1141]|uniref:Putative Branched-chain amino acid ABC transporter (Permease protein) livH-like protein n=1 Tax=Neorhizobium galegae bv. officinalis bv. officinalis str. HAMBI 1141 TaxID=1028801 RepID=A0A068TGQ3_NEOGA|nr:Putative Branched-chain amino acid ABC transporter (Permease protein); livH-like protein [Neorhizobium galegae bv. officinalis bv. officinalis str. HAMBI 1141]
MILFQQFFANGVVIGSSYVLVALGLTLIFGILKIVNFAHGEFYMVGGYVAVVGTHILGLSPFPSILLVIVVMILFGSFVERAIFVPIARKDPTNVIIASFGLSIVLQNVALKVAGPEPMLAKSGLPRGAIQIGDVFLTSERLAIVVFAAVTVIALLLVLKYTWVGLSLRAMSENATVARICGINVRRVGVVTFAIGAALAGLAGALMATVFTVQPNAGSLIVMKAFVIVVLAGMGSIEGAIIAGLGLGIIESLVTGYLGNALRDIVGFIFVMAVLTVRPQGLFGIKTDRS